MKSVSIIAVIIVLTGGCATASSDGISFSEKRELRKLVSSRFVIPKNHESDVYGILRAVRASQPERKVDAITFHPTQGVTVYFAAPEKGFSMHGGPLASATREGDVWKIGELWFLM